MKIARGLKDGGVVVGNVFDKYASRNPLVRHLMRGFTNALSDLVLKASPADIHELGCGEGHLVIEWVRQGMAARGSDFSGKVIDIARENALRAQLSPNLFSVRDIYDVQPETDAADLIVCSEVMEHLKNPLAGLAAVHGLTRRHAILTVPREPIWRAMNMARGAYLGDWGNTPGHLQHWSTREFIALAERHFEVMDVRTPLPWTLLLCRVRSPALNTDV